MKPRTLALIVGLVLVVGGFILGFVPPSVAVTNTNIFDSDLVSAASFSCEPVFGPAPIQSKIGLNAAEIAAACNPAESTRAMWVWVLIGLGVLTIVVAAAVRPSKPAAAPPAEAPPAPAGEV